METHDAAARGRRQDGRDAAAVGQAGVEDGLIGVDAAADVLRDVAHRRSSACSEAKRASVRSSRPPRSM